MSPEESTFYRELDFWQVPKPEQFMSKGNDDQAILEGYQFNEFDTDWVASSLKVEGEQNRRVRKQHQSDEHGIVYCKYPMN